MPRFRHLPVEVEAVQLTRETFRAAIRFVPIERFAAGGEDDRGVFVEIEVPEGKVRADEGDWIVRDASGEYYPCKPDAFAAAYEPAGGAR